MIIAGHGETVTLFGDAKDTGLLHQKMFNQISFIYKGETKDTFSTVDKSSLEINAWIQSKREACK